MKGCFNTPVQQSDCLLIKQAGLEKEPGPNSVEDVIFTRHMRWFHASISVHVKSNSSCGDQCWSDQTEI